MAELLGVLGDWTWFIVALVLAIAELIVPGIFFIWLALAAVLVGAITLVLPLGLVGQLGLFAVLAVIIVPLARRYVASHEDETDHPLLNARGASYVGRVFELEVGIRDGRGKVKIGDTVWSAEGPELPAGTRVRVVGADGALLRVEPENG